MYLESIFISTKDTEQQLPEETKKIDLVDQTFSIIMTATQREPKVVMACTMDNRVETLKNLSERLAKCQRASLTTSTQSAAPSRAYSACRTMSSCRCSTRPTPRPSRCV
jgi:hypothetical protein